MKRLVAIGGGELRNFTTLQIDTFISDLVKDPDKRTYALFIPTASHDSKPYFNTFRKTYTSKLGCKVDVAISTKGEMTMEHIKEKIDKADVIYVGGGNTAYMLEEWKKSGLDRLLIDAYERGVVLCGLSAGAICWFKKALSDYKIMDGVETTDYAVLDGLGVLDGMCCPHYNEESRKIGYDKVKDEYPDCLCIEDDTAVYFEDGVMKGSIGTGNAYLYKDGEAKKVDRYNG